MSDGADETEGDSAARGGALPPPQTPLGLDYLAPPEPPGRLWRSVELGVGLIVVGWVPFACGIINVMVADTTYSAVAAGSHKRGALLFLAGGVGTSLLGLWRLATLKHTPGILLAVLVVLVQALIVSCMGAAYLTGR